MITYKQLSFNRLFPRIIDTLHSESTKYGTPFNVPNMVYFNQKKCFWKEYEKIHLQSYFGRNYNENLIEK